MPAEQPVGAPFITLLRWTLEWWLAGQDPGLALLRRNVVALTPVSRWLAAVALALALVVLAGVLMMRRQGADLADAVVGLGRFLLVLSAGWLVLAAAWGMSDALAGWIVGPRAGTQEYVARVEQALSAADPTLARTLALVGTASVLAFVAMVVARVVLATVIAAGLPVIAALSLRRRAPGVRPVGGWLVAVVAFRPLAAVVYRVSHDLVTGPGEPVLVLVVVCLTFLLSGALLPGVARIVTGVQQ